jgi:hypothetical protein
MAYNTLALIAFLERSQGGEYLVFSDHSLLWFSDHHFVSFSESSPLGAEPKDQKGEDNAYSFTIGLYLSFPKAAYFSKNKGGPESSGTNGLFR